MIDQQTFAHVVADWLSHTIKPNIPADKLTMRGALSAATEAIRARPDLLYTMAIETFPVLHQYGLFRDSKVDSEVIAPALRGFFDEVGEYNVADHEALKWFTYRFSRDEVKVLCDGLEKVAAAQKTNSHNNT